MSRYDHARALELSSRAFADSLSEREQDWLNQKLKITNKLMERSRPRLRRKNLCKWIEFRATVIRRIRRILVLLTTKY